MWVLANLPVLPRMPSREITESSRERGSGCQVSAHRLVPVGQGPADQAAERLKGRVRDAVASEEAVAPPGDEPLLEEQGEVLARIGLRGVRLGTELLYRALAAEQRLEERQTRRVRERAEALGDQLERLAGQRRLGAGTGHQCSRPVGAAQVEVTGAAQVDVVAAPAAHVEPSPVGRPSGRFHGILMSTCARPQVPVAPAKVRPAPKKAEIPRNQGFTRVPSATPVNTMLSAMS